MTTRAIITFGRFEQSGGQDPICTYSDNLRKILCICRCVISDKLEVCKNASSHSPARRPLFTSWVSTAAAHHKHLILLFKFLDVWKNPDLKSLQVQLKREFGKKAGEADVRPLFHFSGCYSVVSCCNSS